MERGLYLKDFEPIVQPREFLETYPTKKYYVVDIIYPLPLLEVDLTDSDHLNAAVTTTESAEIEIDDVYLDDGEISHMRIIPRDDFRITWMGKPKARVYMTTRNKAWSIPGIDDPAGVAIEFLNLNEIFQFEDTEMYIKVTANAGSVDPARLEFFGYRMIVKEISSVPGGVKPTKIPVEGYPGASI